MFVCEQKTFAKCYQFSVKSTANTLQKKIIITMNNLCNIWNKVDSSNTASTETFQFFIRYAEDKENNKKGIYAA